jgi:hypothetical protein
LAPQENKLDWKDMDCNSTARSLVTNPSAGAV